MLNNAFKVLKLMGTWTWLSWLSMTLILYKTFTVSIDFSLYNNEYLPYKGRYISARGVDLNTVNCLHQINKL